ncbi:Chromosome segregation protein pcs1 [Verticillium dahliae VDG2]|nr:Chromosome segregation protein pcs1 [Verticillium dahliae VDG2]
MSNNVRYDTWDKERLICRVRQLEMEIRHRDAAAKKAVALTHSAPSTPGGDSSSAAAAPPPAKKRKKGAANIDPSRYSYRYVALRLAYLGKNYNGFEHQQSAVQATIESELWSALTKACLIFPPGEDIDQIDFNYKELDYSKCGRTDKGVSAFGQVIGLRLRSSKPLPKTAAQLEEEARKKAEALQEKQKQQQHDGQGDVSMQDAAVEQQQQPSSPPPAPKPWDPIKDELPYCKTLNRLLPPDIRILAWCPSTPEGFSARFSCTERHVLFLVGQGLERPEVVDELLDVERHPRKPNYGLAHEVPLVLWDCIFPTDRSVPEGQQADGMAWEWEAGENKYGAGGLVDVLWAGWREKKMDELLANRLLDLVSLQGCPEANPAQNVKWNVLQKVYAGGNEGRLAGEHLPLMKRKVVPSPMEINDRWAQRMGYGSSEELLKEENWRVSLAKDRRARREGGSGTATPAAQEPEA